MPPTLPAKLSAMAKALGRDDTLFDEQGAGALLVDGIVLLLQYFVEDDAQVLVLAADLGPLAQEARARVYPMMLAGNTSWRSVAGGALALDETRHHAMLMLRLDLAELDGAALTGRLHAFSDAAVSWRARLDLSQPDGAAPPAAQPEPAFIPASFA
ncbi:type III secretion system chaperone [Achromobacter denitrificans]|uniref:type III secretion system chaperone n=1 Tax=Achromobacter denitrificans TaxID=32002 RepID=UPI0023E787EB|nr:type III secretion system chaperone [Achromobacter denitrificans]MDF3847684.1 type III secretion system chaperone [Achromobacter denitrificans]